MGGEGWIVLLQIHWWRRRVVEFRPGILTTTRLRVAPLQLSLFSFSYLNLSQGLTDDLTRAPDTLEDLKFVLRVIADIRDKSLEVELRYTDIQERYRTLLMYEIEVREMDPARKTIER